METPPTPETPSSTTPATDGHTSAEGPSPGESPAKAKPTGPAEDLTDILARLRAAQRKSGPPTYEQRVASLEKLELAIVAHQNDIAAAISRDFGGRSKGESLGGEIFPVVSSIRFVKQRLREWMEPREREVGWVFLPARCEVLPQPLGVVGIISPWNYPLYLALGPLIDVLAAGNRAMLKPSELVPETSALLRDIIAEVFPTDQVTVVTGGSEVGEAFARLPFDHLVFTGSTRVGRLVMRAAAENLVPVTLELGGKSPTIIGAGYSARTAAERILTGKLYNAGQTCISPDYVLLPAGEREPFVEACKQAVAKMYPTLENNADYTAIVNDKHLARLRGYLQDAKAKGARVVEIVPAGEAVAKVDPGAGPSRKLPPTLVLDTTEDMAVMQEEIFGPILPIVTYQKLDEAIDYVNDHPRPLALYYFGHDKASIDRVLTETVSGGVGVNETLLHIVQDDLPFGGVGPSGMGQYHGREGFEAFTKMKPVFHQSRINTTGLMRPPHGKFLERLVKFIVS
jgi:acyl-CoA reductase-like NAD-dependent aldehyde dehydrogenase